MADKTYDGVVEAVHYAPDGKVDWVRVYLRRGPTWSDRLIFKRQDLIDLIRAGKKMMIGQRIDLMAGTFEVSHPVRVAGANGSEWLVASSDANRDSQGRDTLEGTPLL